MKLEHANQKPMKNILKYGDARGCRGFQAKYWLEAHLALL